MLAPVNIYRQIDRSGRMEQQISGSFEATRGSDVLAILATGAAFFMIVLDTSIVNLALPRIQNVFKADLATLQWLVDGYALVFATLLLSAGALGDRYGAKTVFILGLIVFSLASVFCGFAPNIGSLQCARAFQGVGAAMLLPNSLAALNHTVKEPSQRTAAISAWTSAGALGITMGPVAGGALVELFDWRSIFLVNVPVGLAAIWLARTNVETGPRQVDRAFDPIGQILAITALAALTNWLVSIGRLHARSGPVIFLGLACALLIAAFLIVEARHPSPMLPLDILAPSKMGWVASRSQLGRRHPGCRSTPRPGRRTHR
jgi:MFS transporter, DHA2 family, methylenomycin A resistance protein